MLLEHPGEVLSRENLQQRIWPADTFVGFDQGLSNAIKRLHEALSDSAESPRFIEIPGVAIVSSDLSKIVLLESSHVLPPTNLSAHPVSPTPAIHSFPRSAAHYTACFLVR